MTFLDFIRSKGETTYTLAKKSGVSVRTLEMYTSGRNRLRNARAHIVISLSEALGVTARELVEATDE